MSAARESLSLLILDTHQQRTLPIIGSTGGFSGFFRNEGPPVIHGRIELLLSFTCNICGAFNEVENFATEPASCVCGSNVRLRALIHLLSIELFGQSLSLTEFPKLKAIRGLGMTDKDAYARLLAEK